MTVKKSNSQKKTVALIFFSIAMLDFLLFVKYFIVLITVNLSLFQGFTVRSRKITIMVWPNAGC